MSEIQPVTICGSFGFGNAGDEAVPLAISDLSHSLKKECDFHVLSRFCKPSLSQVIGLGEDDTERREKLRGNINFVCGGGVIEPSGNCVLFRCAKYYKRSFARKNILFGASVEPGVKYSFWKKMRIKRILESFDKLYVRDVLSAEALENVVPNREIQIIGDTVLVMEPGEDIPQELEGINRYIAVALAPRWKDNSNWLTWISTELIQLAKKFNATLVFVPFSVMYDDDRVEHTRVIEYIQSISKEIPIVCIDRKISPREIAKTLKEAFLVLGMRLHACVMAYAQKTPFVGISYHPKLKGFAKTVGWEHLLLPTSLPLVQNKNTYGYAFEDLSLHVGDLVDMGIEAVNYADFSMLEEYKVKLKSCLAIALG